MVSFFKTLKIERTHLLRYDSVHGRFKGELAVDNGQDSLFTDLRDLAAQYPDPDVPEVSAECRQPGSAEGDARPAVIPKSRAAGR